MLEFEKTNLDKVLKIKPSIFEDYRGEIIELYNKDLYSELVLKELGEKVEFVADKISISFKNTFRGLHGDSDTWKLISCIHGRLFLIVLNIDIESIEFGQWQSFILSDKNMHQILVPPKFANGHLVLSEKAIFHYKWSQYYRLERQFTIKYNDQRFRIKLPIKDSELILSERDAI